MTTTLTSADRVRYSRHLALHEIAEAGQEKLKAAKVLIIGAGGLGSPASLYLAASGVGTLGIIDNDRVDVSNLQRQILYETATISKPKVLAARRRLLALNPDIRVIAHDVELKAANAIEIFANYDIVLDGTDRFTTRYLANDTCVILGKALVSAAIHRFEGQAMTYVPGLAPCYRCLFPDPPAEGLVPNCAEAGVLGVLPGVMGTIQATEAIKLIIGVGELLTGRFLTYDALAMHFAEFRFARRSDCAVCGDAPSITQPRDLLEVCSAEVLAAVRTLSAHELRLQIEEGSAVQVVDVREPREFATSHLPGAINIPVRQLTERASEIPRSKPLVFVCRSGARSLTACGLAHRAGIVGIGHLEGGLLAWSTQVDPKFEVAPVA